MRNQSLSFYCLNFNFRRTKHEKYIAAIRSEYIRDTQMFDAEGTPIFNEEFEDKWKDTDGHLIVWEGRAENEKRYLRTCTIL